MHKNITLVDRYLLCKCTNSALILFVFTKLNYRIQMYSSNQVSVLVTNSFILLVLCHFIHVTVQFISLVFVYFEAYYRHPFSMLCTFILLYICDVFSMIFIVHLYLLCNTSAEIVTGLVRSKDNSTCIAFCSANGIGIPLCTLHLRLCRFLNVSILYLF